MKTKMKYVGLKVRKGIITIKELPDKELIYGVDNNWESRRLLENATIDINEDKVLVIGNRIFARHYYDLLWDDVLKINGKHGTLIYKDTDMEERKVWWKTKHYLKNNCYEYTLREKYNLTSNLPYKMYKI